MTPARVSKQGERRASRLRRARSWLLSGAACDHASAGCATVVPQREPLAERNAGSLASVRVLATREQLDRVHRWFGGVRGQTLGPTKGPTPTRSYAKTACSARDASKRLHRGVYLCLTRGGPGKTRLGELSRALKRHASQKLRHTSSRAPLSLSLQPRDAAAAPKEQTPSTSAQACQQLLHLSGARPSSARILFVSATDADSPSCRALLLDRAASASPSPPRPRSRSRSRRSPRRSSRSRSRPRSRSRSPRRSRSSRARRSP